MENLGFISSHTRAQAIWDSILIDATPMAKRTGFKYPVFITPNLWAGYIEPAPQLQQENTISRLWDTLTNLATTIESTKHSGNCLLFTVAFEMYFDGKRSTEVVKLKSIIKPGYNSTKVITIMLPDEG